MNNNYYRKSKKKSPLLSIEGFILEPLPKKLKPDNFPWFLETHELFSTIITKERIKNNNKKFTASLVRK